MHKPRRRAPGSDGVSPLTLLPPGAGDQLRVGCKGLVGMGALGIERFKGRRADGETMCMVRACVNLCTHSRVQVCMHAQTRADCSRRRRRLAIDAPLGRGGGPTAGGLQGLGMGALGIERFKGRRADGETKGMTRACVNLCTHSHVHVCNHAQTRADCSRQRRRPPLTLLPPVVGVQLRVGCKGVGELGCVRNRTLQRPTC